jgi:hypothetical protein
MWSWLKNRLSGHPTIESVAREAIALLRANGAQSAEYDPRMNEVRAQRDGHTSTIFLGNLFHEYVRAPRAERPAVLRKFVLGNMMEAAEMPEGYEAAKPRLLPIVRTAADEAMGFLSAQRLSPAAAADEGPPRLASRPLAGPFIIGLAFDTPNAIRRIDTRQLEKWQVDFDRVLDDALQNLRGLPEHGGWQQVAAGVWRGAWGDSYEPSRILLPDLIRRLEVADPVALMPVRNALLVCSARNEAGLGVMAALAKAAIESEPRWLSLTPLALAGDRWEVFTPPESCARAFLELAFQDTAQTYAGQKNMLDDLHQRRGMDIFVASATGVEKDGRLMTYSVWTEGVDTLLPRTDLVVLSRIKDGQIAQSIFVPWDAAVAALSALMEPTDDVPPRFRARKFPDADQWTALAAAHGAA